jgi:hypothetical protein
MHCRVHQSSPVQSELSRFIMPPALRFERTVLLSLSFKNSTVYKYITDNKVIMRLSRLRAASASATRFLRLRRDGAWLVELLRLAIDLSGKWHAALPRARHRIYMCPASRGVVGACPGAAMHVSRPVVHALSRNTHSAASSRRHLLAHTAEIDLYHPDLLQHLSRRIWCIVSAFFFTNVSATSVSLRRN